MAITKSEFKQAFREVVSLEFSHVPTDENNIQYTFSENFNKRMKKLIESQKKVYWHFVNTSTKRAAIIFVAILTLFTATFSVKAIREPIIKFIKQVYETFTHYSFDGYTTKTIAKEYSITQTPKGFEQIDKIKNDYLINTIYENSSGEVIKFFQKITESNSGLFEDNENTVISKITVNSIEIELQEWYDTKTALWTYDGYFFSLECYGNIDFDTIKQIIESVK